MNPINRIVIKGDQEIGRNFIGEANSQMNILLNQMSFQKLNQGVREVKPSTGVTIKCIKIFNHQECTIIAEARKPELLNTPHVVLTYKNLAVIIDLKKREPIESIVYGGDEIFSPFEVDSSDYNFADLYDFFVESLGCLTGRWYPLEEDEIEMGSAEGINGTIYKDEDILAASGDDYYAYWEKYNEYDTVVGTYNPRYETRGASYAWIYPGDDISSMPDTFANAYTNSYVRVWGSGLETLSLLIIITEDQTYAPPVRFHDVVSIPNGDVAVARDYRYGYWVQTLTTSTNDRIIKYWKLDGTLFYSGIEAASRRHNYSGVADVTKGNCVLIDSAGISIENVMSNTFFDLHYSIDADVSDSSISQNRLVDMSGLSVIRDSEIVGFFNTTRSAIESYMNSGVGSFHKNIQLAGYFSQGQSTDNYPVLTECDKLRIYTSTGTRYIYGDVYN